MERAISFYSIILGMKVLGDVRIENQDIIVLGYSDRLGALYLIEDTSGNEADILNPGYWKIGITSQDIDEDVKKIRAQGWQVSNPVQFRDIGYLCHLQDPEGNVIELLQHTFKGKSLSNIKSKTIAHISIRVQSPSVSISFYEGLGMRLLSKQQASGFDLYFLAETADRLPVQNIESVEIREWLWQRPYTIVELQHVHENTLPYEVPNMGHYGWQGMVFKRECKGIALNNNTILEKMLQDPDGYSILGSKKSKIDPSANTANEGG